MTALRLPEISPQIPLRVCRTDQRSATPFYILLLLDIGNGCWTLLQGDPPTAVAMAAKGVVALHLAVNTAWSGRVVAALVVPILCTVAYAATRADALFVSSTESALLLAKTSGATLLLALMSAYARCVDPDDLMRYLRTAIVVIACSLILGIAGYGHDRYGDDALLAANGFLSGGNETNVALLALFWWLSAMRAEGACKPLDTALYWLCAALMVASGSKTTLLSAAIIALWFLRQHPLRLLGLLAFGFVGLRILVTTSIWSRWILFFWAYLDEGVLSALTSGRFGRAGDALATWSALPPQGTPFLAASGYVESDPIDLLLNFGWCGIALTVLYALVLFRCTNNRLLPSLLILAASALAGHVMYSVFAAPMIAASFARSNQMRSVQASHVAVINGSNVGLRIVARRSSAFSSTGTSERKV